MIRAAILLCLMAGPAWAECVERDQLREVLRTKYDEHPMFRGLNGFGNMVEVFGALDGSTWTIVVFRPDGMACPVDGGRVFVMLERPAAGDPS